MEISSDALPRRKDRVSLSDGAGGELMQRMLSENVLPLLSQGDEECALTELDPSFLDDSASVGDTALTIDGYTVWPLEFPGGDIGRLAVCGTVNDLSVVGARPEALALSYVIEEGMDIELLRRISASVGSASKEAGVRVVTGDTKVVERGGVRGMIITTSGIGRRSPNLDPCLERSRTLREGSGMEWKVSRWLRDDLLARGDSLIVTGNIGTHGVALLSFREGYGFHTDLSSDAAPLNSLMERAMVAGGIVAAKDLTRGGLANGLNEWAMKSGCQLEVDEASIPILEAVRSATDMLGLDPLEIGNEGVALIAAAPGAEEDVLEAISKDMYGAEARMIGKAVDGPHRAVLRTVVGGKRIIDPPHGDPVPRIC
ncbi:MAG: AIR synthase-related protein [Candidatus Thermoplasmatota archaeon]|nr:AIR synthase-related protein [Candidatus Thermoplasmatota archaeon]